MEGLLDRQAPPSLGGGDCVNRRGGKPGPAAELSVFFGRFRKVFFDGSASFGESINALLPRATSRTHSLSCTGPEKTGEFFLAAPRIRARAAIRLDRVLA